MRILEAIGSTPLVELRRIVPDGSARIVAKLESSNPTGSMKDRMALAAISAAEADERLRPGGTVIEYTGGTTGVSLAFVSAARGYRIRIIFSDAFSEEKGLMMQALGAEVMLVPSYGQGISQSLIKRMIEKARALSEQPGSWWVDQLHNRDAIAGYLPLGEEIWQQTGGDVQAFVHAVGTAHSLHGTVQGLRSHKEDLLAVAVEPDESAVLSGDESGSHNIEGVGIGYLPPLWEPEQVDEIIRVSTDAAKAMTRKLARSEGIFAGTSSGANIVAALDVAKRLGPSATVATIIVDSGLRYLSTDVYRNGTPNAA
jgi:cysteine synthase A